MLTIAQIASPGEIEAARSLIREFTAWVLSFEKDAAQAPTFRNLEAELVALPGIYGPPSGRMLLAILDGAHAGCVAFRAHGADTAEMKRMYVRPECRGRNVGARLVAALIAEARSLGYRRLILDSHVAQTHAHAIYRAAGFRDTSAPPDFPDDWRGVVICSKRKRKPNYNHEPKSEHIGPECKLGDLDQKTLKQVRNLFHHSTRLAAILNRRQSPPLAAF